MTRWLLNSTNVMIVLLGFYLLIGLLAASERNWWRALYYVGAIVISVAVLEMTTR